MFEEFKGALTEQYVAQELAARGIGLYHYSTKNSSGEIDFIVQREDYIIPVEVKAEENLKAQSLKAFRYMVYSLMDRSFLCGRINTMQGTLCVRDSFLI